MQEQDRVMPHGREKFTVGIVNPFLRRYTNRLYKEWAGMHHRCYRPTASHFEHYGGRGIQVCAEWSGHDGFDAFAQWSLDNGYAEGLEIDRIDTDDGYRPDNCRWVNHKDNSRNRNTYRNAVRASKAISVDEKIIGVIFRPSKTGVGGKWRAMITVDGKNISLGSYARKEDAIQARLNGERKYWGGDDT